MAKIENKESKNKLAQIDDSRPAYKEARAIVYENRNNEKNLKYDDELHCKAVLDVIGVGNTVKTFCCMHGICLKTFHNWVERYPSFKKCYRFGMLQAESLVEDIGLYYDSWDSWYWGKRMTLFNIANMKSIPALSSSDPIEKIKGIEEAHSLGYIDTKNMLDRLNAVLKQYMSLEFIQNYQKTYGSNGTKDVSKMSQRCLKRRLLNILLC